MFLRRKLRSKIIQAVAESATPLGGGEDLNVLTLEQLSEVKKHFQRPKFFILGHSRSGTTLLGRLIGVHPEIYCNWNGRFFNWDGLVARVASPSFIRWLDGRGNRWVYEKDLAAPLLRVMCDYIMERDAEPYGQCIIGDKTTNDEGALVVDWLHKIYPDAHLIFIVRDGRSVVLSMRIRLLSEYPELLNKKDLALREKIRRDNEPYFSGKRSIFTGDWLVRETEAWARNIIETDQLATRVYGDHYTAVKFEDLLGNPFEELSRLWRFLGVQEVRQEIADEIKREMERNPTASWQSEKEPDLVSGLKRGARGGWKKVFTQDDHENFMKIAGKALDAWGYETEVK
jgi:hypothetical protein